MQIDFDACRCVQVADPHEKVLRENDHIVIAISSFKFKEGAVAIVVVGSDCDYVGELAAVCILRIDEYIPANVCRVADIGRERSAFIWVFNIRIVQISAEVDCDAVEGVAIVDAN